MTSANETTHQTALDTTLRHNLHRMHALRHRPPTLTTVESLDRTGPLEKPCFSCITNTELMMDQFCVEQADVRFEVETHLHTTN